MSDSFAGVRGQKVCINGRGLLADDPLTDIRASLRDLRVALATTYINNALAYPSRARLHEARQRAMSVGSHELLEVCELVERAVRADEARLWLSHLRSGEGPFLMSARVHLGLWLQRRDAVPEHIGSTHEELQALGVWM